jgi:hypothetical protein
MFEQLELGGRLAAIADGSRSRKLGWSLRTATTSLTSEVRPARLIARSWSNEALTDWLNRALFVSDNGSQVMQRHRFKVESV